MPVTQERVLLRPKIDEFLTYCRVRNLSTHTIRAYLAALTEFADGFGCDASLVQIHRKSVRAFMVHLRDVGKSGSTVRQRLAAVKSFCRWLENEGLIDATLLRSFPVKPIVRDQLPAIPSEEDLKTLLDGDLPGRRCPERDALLLELLYSAGLRASEVIGANVSDFQDKDVLLVRGKGKKERLVIIGEYAQRALGAWLPVREKWLRRRKIETEALFFSIGSRRSVERLDVRNVGRIVKAVAKAKGLPEYNPHVLRHACGTHMHDHNAPLQAVAAFLGHAQLGTAQIYTRVSKGRMMNVYRRAHPHGIAYERAGLNRPSRKPSENRPST